MPLLLPTVSCLGSEERPDRPVGLTVRYSPMQEKITVDSLLTCKYSVPNPDY